MLDYVSKSLVICSVCSGDIHWISCPTGGWWAHYAHPEDGHDAEAKINPDHDNEDYSVVAWEMLKSFDGAVTIEAAHRVLEKLILSGQIQLT
jgi:hypothetical protein